MDIRVLLAQERRDLADVLDALSPQQWDAPSLAEGWRVRDVVAHLVMPFRYSLPRVAFNMLKARGDFNKMADRVARTDGSALSPAELSAALRSNADHPWKPPGAGYDAPLTDLTMHGLDICRPLAIERDRRPQTLRVVLDSLVGARSLKFFGLDLSGIELVATDLDWRYGAGEPANGAAEDLILALGARAPGAAALSGAGAGTLAGRSGSSR